jgi:putative selenate reductase
VAELVPAPFADLVTRLYEEPARQDALFELPRRRWYQPPESGPDLSVRFHGRLAGNPAGPAAGPHTQMAQNLLLSYVSGARILELKTVQVDDHLVIPRPCIDMTNVGYNVEWSQELLVGDSLREYVAGSMLIHMFRQAGPAGEAVRAGTAGEVLYDISVGYDLAGIRSGKVVGFLDGMRDASQIIDRLRGDIPRRYAAARDLDYPARLSDSVTLSTFHGCPAGEIEGICEFLIGEHGFDVIVKMNPPMLGRERLEHLLHDELGYTEIRVNPKAYASGLMFDEGVELARRLGRFAAARGRSFGFKFSNTLEVVNHRAFFTPANEIMYLSGQPLHVITLTLTDVFRQAVGPDVPISFSAGVDQFNFPAAVACGFVPVTISTDLLRPGGYGRLPAYLKRLADEMRRCGAACIDEFILHYYSRRGEGPGGEGHAAAGGAPAPAAGGVPAGQPVRPGDSASAVLRASLQNTTIAAAEARSEPRYRAAANGAEPRRIDSHLTTFDCITCDKCLPVCPNAANFTYPTPLISVDCRNIAVRPDGSFSEVGQPRRFEIRERMQIACYADFCNECGNCDTFCPEYGGPYIKKPTFFGSLESWRRAAPRDGFVIGRDAAGDSWIRGRYQGREYLLTCAPAAGCVQFDDGAVEAVFDAADQRLRAFTIRNGFSGEHIIDRHIVLTLHHLLRGVYDESRVNQVNAGWGS